jgi:hypothetical protein
MARQLCMQAGGKAYIGGSIANLGNEYVLGLQTVNCQSGEMLAQEQITANRKEKLLNSLDDAAAKLRIKLGEAHGTIQKFDTPLEQATTPRLEPFRLTAEETEPTWAVTIAPLCHSSNEPSNSTRTSPWPVSSLG